MAITKSQQGQNCVRSLTPFFFGLPAYQRDLALRSRTLGTTKCLLMLVLRCLPCCMYDPTFLVRGAPPPSAMWVWSGSLPNCQGDPDRPEDIHPREVDSPPPAQISNILVDLARAKMFKFKPKNCRFVFVLVLEGRAHRIKSCCDAMLQPKNITTPSDLDILFSGILLLATIHGAMCNGSHIPKTYFSKWMNVAGYISDLPEECLWHLFGH